MWWETDKPVQVGSSRHHGNSAKKNLPVLPAGLQLRWTRAPFITSLNTLLGPAFRSPCCRRTPCSRGSWWWICDPKKTGRALQTWNWWTLSCAVALSLGGTGGACHCADVLYSGAQWPKDCNTSSGETPSPAEGLCEKRGLPKSPKIHFHTLPIRNLNAGNLCPIAYVSRNFNVAYSEPSRFARDE